MKYWGLWSSKMNEKLKEKYIQFKIVEEQMKKLSDQNYGKSESVN